MKKILLLFSAIYFVLTASSQPLFDSTHVAGFRASRITSSYPNNQFPNESYWAYVGNAMASKFDSTAPASFWIVSLYQSAGTTRFNFPNPGGSWPFITFGSTDQNEIYLNRFDQEGFRIWLQVEPGAANMDTMITLVMNKYKHHPCVKGFGVDVEWLNTQTYSGGQHVTDSMAEHWEQTLKSFNPSYTLFLKHYSYSWMPPSFRGDILFVDDSQGFSGLTQMTNEFEIWGNHFPNNKAAFQFGYKADTTWWKLYADPPLTIGNSLRSNISNCYGLFWVDFTICQIFDITVGTEKANSENLLFDIYPNPASNISTLRFELKKKTNVCISVFDLEGKEIAQILDREYDAGIHKTIYDFSLLKQGNYYVVIQTDGEVCDKKLVVLR